MQYTIVTHRKPHLDEVVAIVFLLHFGDKKFPGIKDAKVIFWNSAKTPDGRTWLEWYKEGFILVGVGGSPYDEHPVDGQPRRENECAATLVAKSLGIDKEPRFKELLEYTLQNDSQGGKSPHDLGALITLCNKTHFDNDPQGALEWAMQPIWWKIVQQTKFFTETKKEFDTKCRVIQCNHYGREITVVAGQSDDLEIGAYARSEHGANADVTILRNSKGLTFIITKKRSGINLNHAVIGIRVQEMLAKKLSFRLNDMALTTDGTVPGSEEWYYDSKARWILNGSQSSIDTTPSRIPFDKLVEVVIESLNIKKFSREQVA